MTGARHGSRRDWRGHRIPDASSGRRSSALVMVRGQVECAQRVLRGASILHANLSSERYRRKFPVADFHYMNFPTHFSDAALVALMSKSELPAAGTFYDRHGAMMYGLALHMLGDADSASEVVIDVMAEVWRSSADFSAFSVGIPDHLGMLVREHAIRKVRGRQRHPSLPTERNASVCARAVGSTGT